MKIERLRKVGKWIVRVALVAVIAYLFIYAGFQAFKWGNWPWRLESIHPQELPKFVTHHYLDLESIESISKFRSGIGHDAADSFEKCRSLKHYFMFNRSEGLNTTTVKVLSPVGGTVMAIMPDGREDYQLWIRPNGYPQYSIRIYHTKPLPDIKRGVKVNAGQHVAHHSRNDTNSDMQVGIAGLMQTRFVSYFEVMSDALFEDYKRLGVESRQDFIISKEARDADPLKCRFGFGGTGLFKEERPNERVQLREVQVVPPSESQPSSEFITANPIKLEHISAISKFRSCVGHNYSGYNSQGELEEPNRSMKHYLKVKISQPEVFAPFDGVVVKIDAERANYGKQVHISATGQPWIFVFFHINPNPGIALNSVVKSGELIGRAGTTNTGDSFDFTLVKYEKDQPTYETPFNWMRTDVLSQYVEQGVTKELVVIAKSERDSSPCRFGQQSLEASNWLNIR